MRRPKAAGVVVVVVPPAALDVAPRAATPRGRLEPAGEGAVIHDRVVTVDVAADGSVKLRHRPAAEAKVVRLTMKGFGRLLDEWWKDPAQQTRAGRWQEQPREAQARDPAERHPSDAPQKKAATTARVAGDIASQLFMPRIVGSFDPTAWAMQLAGAGDPYYGRKLKILDETREERAARGAAHRAELEGRAGQIMRRNLQALWARPLSPAERRLALFVMWDECSEEDGPLGEAGALARRAVIGWIRGHLPAGSADAYGAEEIAALNARRVSRQRFEPY
jgi:hypothetical protein